jgi:hypothetical protein
MSFTTGTLYLFPQNKKSARWEMALTRQFFYPGGKKGKNPLGPPLFSKI